MLGDELEMVDGAAAGAWIGAGLGGELDELDRLCALLAEHTPEPDD